MTWADFLEASTAEKLASGKLEPIAEYLKIDMGDDDTVLIACVTAAVRYIIASVGVFPDGDESAELLLTSSRRSVSSIPSEASCCSFRCSTTRPGVMRIEKRQGNQSGPP